MEVNFSLDEMVYNTILKDKGMYHEDGSLHIIDYVKVNKDTRQILVHTNDGEVFIANQDDIFTWEVIEEKKAKAVTKRKNKRKKK